MTDKPKSPGRFYKLVREATPRVLNSRSCPNCRVEKPLERFRRVKRGKGWGFLCDTCDDARRRFLRT